MIDESNILICSSVKQYFQEWIYEKAFSHYVSYCHLNELSFAREKVKDCSLYLAEPVITHDVYGRNYGGNEVNNGVIRILNNNGFSISTNSLRARYVMETEVRCGQVWTFFGLQDACQTAIKFIDQKEEQIVYTDGPKAPRPGLNINYESLRFPLCSQL